MLENFLAMYVFGASFGPLLTGTLSEHFTRASATEAGVSTFTRGTLEPFRGAGLHSAMYLVPVLGGVLALVLFAAACTVRKDMEVLDRWMLSLRGSPGPVPALQTATPGASDGPVADG